jgi:hypothetical protein
MYIPNKFKIDKSGCSLSNNTKVETQAFRSKKIKELLIKLDASQISELLDEAPFMNQLCLLNEKISVAYIINFPETYIFTEKLFLYTLEIYTILEENNAEIFTLKDSNVLIFLPKNQLNACKIAYIENNLHKKNYLNSGTLKFLRQELLAPGPIAFKNIILRKYIASQLSNITTKHPKEQEKLLDNFYKKKIKTKKSEIEKFEKYYINILNECDNLADELFTSKDFERYQKEFSKKTKKFRYPLKEVFGPRRPYSYQMFKDMICKFRNKYLKEKKEYEKNI